MTSLKTRTEKPAARRIACAMGRGALQHFLGGLLCRKQLLLGWLLCSHYLPLGELLVRKLSVRSPCCCPCRQCRPCCHLGCKIHMIFSVLKGEFGGARLRVRLTSVKNCQISCALATSAAEGLTTLSLLHTQSRGQSPQATSCQKVDPGINNKRITGIEPTDLTYTWLTNYMRCL